MDSIYKKIDELQRTILEPYQKILSCPEFISYQKFASIVAQEIAPSFDRISKVLNQTAEIELSGVYKAVQDFADRISENSYEQLTKMLSLLSDTPILSSLRDNVIIHDAYVELNEEAVDTLSPFVELPVIESSTADTPVDNPVPAKYKMSRAEFINILIAIIFGIAGLLLDYSQGRNDSIAQQQQWEIENEQRDESNHLQYLGTIQNAEIIDLLKELLETQETAPTNPSVPDQGEELLDCTQESADPTPSPADDAQTAPDESCSPDADEQ